MTGKRFENRLDKSNVKFNTLNPVWDNEKGIGLNVFEMIDEMNLFNDENEQLKQEIAKFKEWEKYIGDVKREDLDRVFKMSIYEIAEAFEYYRKRIKEYEE